MSFPELFYSYAGSCSHRSCQSFRGQYLTGDTSLQNRHWIDANVRKNHGLLGALSPRNGNGVNGMKEGDTPSFLFVYNNGLMNPEHPEWGGWGGRFEKDREGYFTDAADLLDGSSDERHTISRWRPFFQHEFAARMDWCRTANRDSANHPPLAGRGQPPAGYCAALPAGAAGSHHPAGCTGFLGSGWPPAHCALVVLSSGLQLSRPAGACRC
ncbi:DUF1593 domain-containing protein [bacterium]|nr:DUF1593 domain-containing protein [bacterium]